MFLSKDTDFWMEQTLQYFRSLTGELKMEEDAMAGMLLQRAYQQAFGAFAMSGENEILGSNWGTYPVTPHVWNKDMYYSSLPFTLTEPELCKNVFSGLQNMESNIKELNSKAASFIH